MDAIGICLIISGAVLIGTKKSMKKNYAKGILFALLVGLMIASYSITDKLGVSVVNPIVYLYGLILITTLWLTPYTRIKQKRNLFYAWKNYKKYSLIIGIGSFSTYLIILYIFQQVQVSYVVALRESSVVIGSFLGFKFLGEKFSWKKTLGTFFIFLGIITIKFV